MNLDSQRNNTFMEEEPQTSLTLHPVQGHWSSDIKSLREDENFHRYEPQMELLFTEMLLSRQALFEQGWKANDAFKGNTLSGI
jgi:hypothetical protein